MARILPYLLSVLACASLAACGEQPPRPLRTVILRDGRVDANALTATGVAAGAAPARDVSCALRTGGADKIAGCGFRLHPGQIVFGPYLPLAPGAYEAEFSFATTPGCSGGKVLVDVVTSANNFKKLAQQTLVVRGPQLSRVGFAVDRSLADGALMEFRTSFPGAASAGGCVVLNGLKVLAK
jgi:hypothetical protein